MTTSRRSRPIKSGGGFEWIPTPNAADEGKGGYRHKGGNPTLRGYVEGGLWLTPTVGVVVGGRSDVVLTEGMAAHHRKQGKGNLGDQVAAAVVDRMSSPQGTLANRSVMLGSGGERMTPGTSGLGLDNCLPRSVRTSRAGACLRTLLGTSHLGSTVCSLTWRLKATAAGRPLFRLQASVRFTDGIESGSWPTPTVRDVRPGDAASRQGGASLVDTVTRMWGTPTARDWKSSGSPETASVIRNRDRGMLAEQTIAAQALAGQRLNADFVERLMGYPAGWTVLSASSDAGGSTVCR